MSLKLPFKALLLLIISPQKSLNKKIRSKEFPGSALHATRRDARRAEAGRPFFPHPPFLSILLLYVASYVVGLDKIVDAHCL